MLANTDRYYTNGIKLGVGLPFELLQTPATEVLRQIDPHDGEDVHVGLFVGQNLYTLATLKSRPPSRTIGPGPPGCIWAAWRNGRATTGSIP